MKRFLCLVSCAALALAPLAANSDSTSTQWAVVSAGPHGFDWLIGTWSCINKNPSPLAGPASATFTAVRSNAGGALFIRAMGKGFDTATYLSFDPKTKTWSAPAAFSDGSHEYESSTGTGAAFVFTGFYYSAGAVTKVRDLYALPSVKTQRDVGQTQTAGTWKTTYDITCTKS